MLNTIPVAMEIMDFATYSSLERTSRWQDLPNWPFGLISVTNFGSDSTDFWQNQDLRFDMRFFAGPYFKIWGDYWLHFFAGLALNIDTTWQFLSTTDFVITAHQKIYRFPKLTSIINNSIRLTHSVTRSRQGLFSICYRPAKSDIDKKTHFSLRPPNLIFAFT